MAQEPLTDRVVSAYLADSSTASIAYAVAPCDGYVIDAYAVTAAAVTTASSVVTLRISTSAATTAITGGVITIALTGAAAGKMYQSTSITGNNFVNKGDVIRFDSDGAGSGVVPTYFTAIIRG